jgi:ribosome-associated translation inhibitor RaiA
LTTNCAADSISDISPRFRSTVEERIARLERDADHDEAQISSLENVDHIRRQMRLVAVQRSEALRMRLFLYHAKARAQQPLTAL